MAWSGTHGLVMGVEITGGLGSNFEISVSVFHNT